MKMAFRMQTSVPDITNLASEPASTFELYGADSRTPGTFAANCLLARRLAERGRSIHSALSSRLGPTMADCRRASAPNVPKTDQASAALVLDLKQRGMLDDTLVVWGGEFGRTSYSQGTLTATDYGRDHHPRCFTVWLAGGGIKPGFTYGRTDDYGYNIADDKGKPNLTHQRRIHERRPSTSTTCKPQSSTCLVSTTRSSPTNTKAATTASPMCTGTLCATFSRSLRSKRHHRNEQNRSINIGTADNILG